MEELPRGNSKCYFMMGQSTAGVNKRKRPVWLECNARECDKVQLGRWEGWHQTGPRIYNVTCRTIGSTKD